MFKRLLSALGGQKDKGEAPPGQGEMIVAYDAYGRQMQIARSEWREKVFLPGLQQKWHTAAALYDAIFSGLKDGFAADLIPAAQRLVEIDDLPERGHVMHGIVLIANGQFDAAEQTLRAGIAKVGATGTLLTNLAKVLAGRGDDAGAEAMLWQAVQTDPNLDNGMLWWVSIQRDRGGEPAYLEALHRVAALPGSWRAQLWLARHHLDHHDIAAARALYAEVLAGGQFDNQSLMMISGDLGNHGQIALIIELVAPVYDEHRHDPMAGLNLLRAYQELGRRAEGEALLARLYALGLAPLKQHLDGFSDAFLRLAQQAMPPAAIDPDALEISTVSLTLPIWHYGLCRADWLLAHKPDPVPQIGFIAFSIIADPGQQAQSQREDDLGRFSRAIPLYLAEAVHYWSDHAAQCYISIVEGGGPVVSGREPQGEALFPNLPPAMTHVVTGSLGSTGEGEGRQWQLRLTLWDCVARCQQAVEEGQAGEAEFGALVLQLEQRLLAKIGGGRPLPFDPWYQRPTAAMMKNYLIHLGQSFILTLAANQRIPLSSLWGERAMFDWPLTMALNAPALLVPKLMYLSVLGKAYDYRSAVLGEYRERSLELLGATERPDDPLVLLRPFLWKIFAIEDRFTAYRQGLDPDSAPAYRAWLDRVAEK